jgi:hypothetical protein
VRSSWRWLGEFAEETGHQAPNHPLIDLGEIRQKSGKLVLGWAVQGDLDPSTAMSNTYDMEWPPHSGTVQTFPEIDRVEWFDLDEARRRLKAAQVPFLDRLQAALAGLADWRAPPRTPRCAAGSRSRAGTGPTMLCLGGGKLPCFRVVEAPADETVRQRHRKTANIGHDGGRSRALSSPSRAAGEPQPGRPTSALVTRPGARSVGCHTTANRLMGAGRPIV